MAEQNSRPQAHDQSLFPVEEDATARQSPILLPGERVNFQENTDQRIDEAAKHRQGDFRIVTEQARYQVAQIPDLVAGKEWNLNPDFQRRHRWNPDKQSRLIESIMLNVPIPPIFLYEAELSKFEVMDGLQRLTAISEFYKDSYTLRDLQYFPQHNGKRYSDLDEMSQRGIDRRYLSAVILLHETGGPSGREADLLKQLVFERINSGGVDLTAQESRNALLPGPMNRLCLDLAETPSFRRLWGITTTSNEQDGEEGESSPENHPYYRSMYDVELVLRFFAYRQRLIAGSRNPRNLKLFLDSYLKAANGYKPELLTKLGALFVQTSNLVEQVMTHRAFWLKRFRNGQWQWIEEPAIVAYEPLMLAFSQRLSRSTELVDKRFAIREGIDRFYEENGDRIDGRRVNTRDLAERNKLYLGFLDGHLDGRS
ncbi:DUF262 domain-containing protein [Streptomyces sp. HNM0645]|uniref:DUF262 domain-containing protein n=1 Tax=Streptomyces sp. HNM0645 TaxID=2782343 RepID=UPI0024B6CF02|nr:DUF262 domain-containing protein [Streptomyces sp. HNM0645]MDI9886267.1 DUF262 domain-containing protein [Streptomyces sp. HNM0645]